MRDTAALSRTPPRVYHYLLVLFFASGACALVYEVVWVRILTQVLGNSTFAASVVLASFMAGLAIGGFILGKAIDRSGRPLLAYALLETGIALLALVLPHLFGLLTPLYVFFCSFLGKAPQNFRFAQVGLCFILVLPPTILMGGTLPILSKYCVDGDDVVGKTVGGLYAVNTFGGVTGCLVAGFFFIGTFGLRNTALVAVAANFAVAVGAFVLSSKEVAFRPTRNASLIERGGGAEFTSAARTGCRVKEEQGPRFHHLVLWAIGLSGFTGLAYEVLWARLLVFFAPSMVVYAFSAMLALFLLGFGAGSYFGCLLAGKNKRLWEVFAILQILIAFSGIMTVPLITRLHSFEEQITPLVSFISDMYWHGMSSFIISAMVVILLPSILLGAVFPVSVGIYADDHGKIGNKVGSLYAANTIGAVLGSIVAGFVLAPGLGTQRGLIFTAGINLLIAVLVFLPLRKNMRSASTSFTAFLPLAFTLCFVLAGFFWLDGDSVKTVFAKGDEAVKVIYAEESAGGTVTVEQLTDYSRRLAINGINVAGDDFKFRTLQTIQVHLPLLLHGHPREVLQIGLGSGATTWAISRHDVKRIDVAELISGVVGAAHYFTDVNHGVLNDKRVSVTVDDVRSFLLRGSRRYDAILSDSIHPTVAGNGLLYSVEYFRLCQRRLKPDGIFSTYLPFYGLTAEDHKIILRSMKKVFPYVYIWHTPAGRNEWAIVTGLNKPLSIDMKEFARYFWESPVREDLAAIMINHPSQLLSYFLLDSRAVSSWIGSQGRLNTDDNGYLEYVASKRSDDRRQTVKATLQELLARRCCISPYLKNVALHDVIMQRYIRERDHILTGRLLELKGEFYLARREFKNALKVNPTSETAWDMLGCSQIGKTILLRAAQQYPDDYQVYERLGFLSLSGNDFSAADRWFRKAVALKADAIAAQLGWSRACLELGRYEEAVEHLKSVNRLGPTPWVDEKARNEAELIYSERVVRYLPKSPDAQNRLAAAYWARGNYDLSLRAFETAAALAPGSIAARINLGTRYENVWEFKKARSVFETVLQSDERNGAAKAHLAELRDKMRYPDLIAYLAAQPLDPTAVPTGPETGMPHYEKALEYWSERLFVNATREMERAARYSSRYLPDLARLYEIRGMYDKAAELIQRMPEGQGGDQGEERKRTLMRLRLLRELRKRPDTREEEERYRRLSNTLANVYWQEGEFEQAKDTLKRLIPSDPHAGVLYANLGRCCESTGELPEAVATYRKAFALDPNLDFARNSLARLRDATLRFGPK